MCYDAAQLAFRVYKEAVRLNASKEEIDHLRTKWEKLEKAHSNYYHVSGYQHPKLLAYHLDKENKLDIDYFYWGLIPHWTKDEQQAQDHWNSTINARVETLATKPSFRDAYKQHRCLIPLQGFYEYHHKNGKSFPYFIREKDIEIMFVAGIFDEWLNKETGELVQSMSLVTTRGKDIMAKIHNNPKLEEPRMPLILPDDLARIWLESPEQLENVHSIPLPALDAHTVRRLRGQQYPGNVEEVWQECDYPELNDQQELF